MGCFKISEIPSFAELINVKDKKVEQQIVEELLSNNKNLSTKTELQKPILWSTESVFEDFLLRKGLTISANLMKLFTESSFKHLISLSRKGRLEYLQALQSIREKEESKNPISMDIKR